ncbi:uncharacterized protein LOC119735894 [Patiria miniata]|uniref:Uncharacterized protein n=1 Tax=Patiria miniata TaxID=46514 RepID=A0A914APT3_PATMI|nr:uncharacterized protein LOC119735894 [Patiria miniata]
MYSQTGQTVLDVDTILGLPRPTKKPSSLRKPRPPAPPKYINKERALAIAKKFKINQIGKVSVRAGGSNALDDPPRVSVQSEKVLTRRILLDREKGLETAMNTKDSAVGKCILGRNDYETRRLGVEFEKLSEDVDRKSYQLLKRKSVFVHQRGLILTQGGIVFDPTSATNNRRDDAKTGADATKPLPGIQTTQAGDEAPADSTPRPKRDKSPSYMRPLSCDRTKSTDSQVAEAERFLATPTMMRYANKGNPDEDSSAFALKSVGEVNSHNYDADFTRVPSKRTFQTERRKSQLPEIAESVSSEGSEDVFGASAAADRGQKITNSANFPITAALNRSKSVDQGGAGVGSGNKRRRARTVDSQSKPDETNEADTRGPSQPIKSRRRSHRKSSTFSTTSSQFKPTKKMHRKTRVSFTQKPAPNQFNTSEPSRDPRFTELTSFLIPDSAKAFDLYRDMGRLSVLERLDQSDARSSGVRTQMGKIGHSRKKENQKSFDALY